MAERVLYGAQAALYPHLAKQGMRNWWQSWSKRTKRRFKFTPGARPVLTVNGRPIGTDSLKRGLKRLFGKGLEE